MSEVERSVRFYETLGLTAFPHPSGLAARQTRVAELLRWTEQDLVDWDASEHCLQAFREHVLARFGST